VPDRQENQKDVSEKPMSILGGVFGKLNFLMRSNRIGEVLVHRKKLTQVQLSEALALQKQLGQPLGAILLDYKFITRRDLKSALTTQSAIRIALTVITIFSGLTSLSSRQAQASGLKEIPRSISVSFTTASAASVTGVATRPMALFGTGERASTDLSSFTKWSAMFDRFSREVNSGSANEVVQDWKDDLTALKGKPLYEMANDVNNLMNKIRYIGDKKNWGRSDYWETPIEFLSYGGDCEDFAIAKYVSLRALGVPDKAMRIAVVKDLEKGIPHAILIVYTEQGPMVLDNQIKQMTSANRINHYKPIFTINRSAWWLHTDDKNSNPTQIASAAR